MKKIAVVLIALSFILTSCSGGNLLSGTDKVVNHTNANYVDYSEGILSKTEGNKVLFFHATWCGSCTSASKNIAESVTTDNFTVFKLDYDSSTELKQKYEVNSQHTFVQVDKDGTMIAKWSGSKNISDIQKNIKTYTEPTMVMSDENMMIVDGDMMMDDSKMMDKETMSDSKDEMIEEKEVMMKKEGKFVTYSAEEVASTEGTKVLFFHAKWCPACVGAAKNLSASTAPDGLNVFKVDYDTSAELKKLYGVVGQHTFVQIDDNGKMLKRWFGSRSYEDILAQL